MLDVMHPNICRVAADNARYQDMLERNEALAAAEEARRESEFDAGAANDPEGYGVGFSYNAQELMGDIVNLAIEAINHPHDCAPAIAFKLAAIALVEEARNEYIYES